MKLINTFLLVSTVAEAFVIPGSVSYFSGSSSSSTILQSQPTRQIESALATAFISWTIMSSQSLAIPSVTPEVPIIRDYAPTTILAGGAYVPESGYASLDLSMPKYNVKDVATPKSDLITGTSSPKAIKKAAGGTKAAKRGGEDDNSDGAFTARAEKAASKIAAKKAEREAIQRARQERAAAQFQRS